MNQKSKVFLSGLVIYASSIAHIFFLEKTQIKYFFLDFPAKQSYSFGNAYAWFTGATCRAFTAYKFGEAFSDESLESKLIGSFVGGVAMSGGFAKFLQNTFKMDSIATVNIILGGLGSAALTYIWHEDSDASEMDQTSTILTPNIQEESTQTFHA